MSLGEKLQAAVGKNIDRICPNRFHDPAANHCAHFVSHMCGIDFSFHCVQFKGGSGERANIRVHEIFAQCPKVGVWDDADENRTQLIFVTAKSNVNVGQKRMGNIPQKHIGVYHQGTVFHYGNTADKVTTDTPESFLDKFQRLYSGDQGLYFGFIPGENLTLNVQPTAANVSARRRFEIPDPADGRWQARLVGEPDFFLVGKETVNEQKGFFGLFTPVSEYWGPTYSGDDYFGEIHQWAYLLEVTGACESENRFNLVNTYDRAKFTFGFYQLAAHTPKDNLILLFRRLAELPGFADYYPELAIRDGKLTRVDSDGSATNLEDELPTGPGGSKQLQLFMNYLNPNRRLIERQEALQAARLIHWCVNDPAMRKAQVEVAAEILQHKMAARHSPKLGLDGKSDTICAIVADIFHQGRGTYNAVKPLLDSSDPEEALLTFRDDEFRGRNTRLRGAVASAKQRGKLGRMTYRAALNEFG